MNFSGMSTTDRSTGSRSRPFSWRVMTFGFESDSSKPSRRIVSTSTASCSSPRALTRKESRFSVCSYRMLTL